MAAARRLLPDDCCTTIAARRLLPEGRNPARTSRLLRLACYGRPGRQSCGRCCGALLRSVAVVVAAIHRQ
jgi:hypothetical protein